MAGYRIVLSLALTIAAAQLSWAQSPATWTLTPGTTAKTADGAMTTRVYSLAEMGDDANLCKWLAETIPQMIQPGTWAGEGRKNLSYYAPGKVLVICHTAAVHAQVDEFLQSLKKSLPARQARHDAQVVPAQFFPEGVKPGGPLSAAQAYPVPYPPQAPKHLFHFIIRYEGEGIIDSNVAKFARELVRANRESSSNSSNEMPSPIVPSSMYLRGTPQYLPPSDAPKMPLADAPVPPPMTLPTTGTSSGNSTPSFPSAPVLQSSSFRY
jgi:hypothetical protein